MKCEICYKRVEIVNRITGSSNICSRKYICKECRNLIRQRLISLLPTFKKHLLECFEIHRAEEKNRKIRTKEEHSIAQSAASQGIPLSEWKEYANEHPYCPKFNESIREHIREKYDRKCFICGKPESENITTTGKQRKLSVHHVDRNKSQGCDGHDWVLVPLCIKHHGITHNELWTARIIWLLNNVW